jgi:serine-type D-Ala-D-Ala carboxypeptidase/endopeptidase (penicillin-binding protein 4)
MTKIGIAITCFLAGCSPAFKIKKEIGIIEQSLQDHSGFFLYDVATSKTLIDFNGAKYFTPASNTKIFTFFTSLRLLGDSVTSIKYTVRNDSMTFQGMGDPSFLYKNVFNNGRVYDFLKGFPGRLFFSSANFKTESLGMGWAWNDYNNYYSAERSSFPLFGNLIEIEKPQPEKFIFRPARFSSDFHASNEVHDYEEIVRDIDSNELVYFDGKKKAAFWTIPFNTSSDLITDLLSDTLHRSVETIHKPLGQNSFVLKSVPVDSLYKVMMQQSDNFIAEQLLLQCAGVISDTLKPEIAIRYAIKNFFSDLQDKPQWVDGSGLSRHNLFTPRSIVTLWKKIYETVPQERLFKLLATGGVSGTIKNWFRADKPYVFAKTGSLSNNRCLSGFLLTKRNKILIFSFMNNNFIAPGSEVRKGMERVLNQIHDNY